MTEADVLDLLHRRYGIEPKTNGRPTRRFACADHVPQGPFGDAPIADFIAVDCWRGRDNWPILGFEIKCSRSDWLREFADPDKAGQWVRYCTRWSLVVSDRSIVKPGELPTGWGLLAVSGARLVTIVEPSKLHPEPMPHQTSVALLRQVQKAATHRTFRGTLIEAAS